MEKRVTIRILASTHRRLRVIAAQKGVSLMQAVDEVSKIEVLSQQEGL